MPRGGEITAHAGDVPQEPGCQSPADEISAIIAFARAMRDLTGNLPPMPGVFPDYPAPIVRHERMASGN